MCSLGVLLLGAEGRQQMSQWPHSESLLQSPETDDRARGPLGLGHSRHECNSSEENLGLGLPPAQRQHYRMRLFFPVPSLPLLHRCSLDLWPDGSPSRLMLLPTPLNPPQAFPPVNLLHFCNRLNACISP